jgi:uncharacterized C2H2 Zn-finger protein
MKKTMSLTVAAMVSVMLVTPLFADMSCCDTAKGVTAGGTCASCKEVYTCPMHPDVTSDKPGKCPTCGMFLAKKTASQKAVYSKKVAGYSCPMHADVKCDKAGKCPKCGMKLEKQQDNNKDIKIIKD